MKWDDTPAAASWEAHSRWGDRLRVYQEKRARDIARKAAAKK